MKSEKFDLSKLRIASPCPVGWDNMRGGDRKRFCGLFELNVYNVTGMTADEVRDLVSASEGRLCMRLRRRADGTVITKDCPIGLRAYQKRVARFAGATMAAVLGLFSISFGQKQDKNTIEASKIKIVRTVKQSSQGEITGTITDPQGAVVPGAKIILLSKKQGKAFATSNNEGVFRIEKVDAGQYALQITAPGFKTLKIKNFIIRSGESLDLTTPLVIRGEELIGVVATEEPIQETSSAISTTITTRMIQKLPF